MARVILVIRKIVNRRAYNRANIVDLIPALTCRTNHPSSPSARSFAVPVLLLIYSFHPAVSPFSIPRDEDLKEISLGSFIFHGDASA